MPSPEKATKETFRAVLERLVTNFAANEEEYTSPGYPEAQVRVDFLDPLFRALGWDLENRQGLPYAHRDVIVERGSEEGRPDYTFRLGTIPKFVVEAKAPHHRLAHEDHVFQVKTYAWNTKQVFAAILTDFEEFRFYDASQEPDRNHPHRGLIHDFTYKQYLGNVDKLWEFSRQRVAEGSIEALLPRDKLSLRFRKPPDDKFLEDMTSWRTDLARAVHKRNPQLSASELTDMVQRLLDRLIFIRVAEDRRILKEKSLLDRAHEWEAIGGRLPLLPMLTELFHIINNDFNGEIFKPHACEDINLEGDPTLHRIITELYQPKRPYRFDVIPVDIFGAVYERYLGKTIYVKGKTVTVEDKPEVRKAGGVYYTPKYIVDYIVKNTVGKTIEGKTPKEIEKIRILDPACGSGSFLIGAFQCLIDCHLHWYQKHPKQANVHPMFPDLVKNGNGEPRLSIWRKAKILSHNLFGVDLDPQAVEITMMNLYLKALEGEGDLPRNKRVLPELNHNIVCGNSLASDGVEDTFAQTIRKGGFNAIIGNPPYLSVKRAFLNAAECEYIQKHYKTATRHWDIYEVFIERSIHLLDQDGFWSFIIPKPFLTNENMEPGRDFLLANTRLQRIADCGTPFEDADVEAIIIVAKKAEPDPTHLVQIDRLGPLGEPLRSHKSRQGIFLKLPFKAFALDVDERVLSLLHKTATKSMRLGDLVSITRGIEAGKKDTSILTKPVKGARKLLRGEDVSRYSFAFQGYYVRPNFGDETKFKSPDVYQAPKKILLRRVGARLIAALDTEQYWTLNTVYNVLPNADAHPEFLLALLNSRLLNWWFKTSFVFEDKLFPYVRISQVDQLPIKCVDFTNPKDKKIHDEIVKTTKKILGLARSKDEKQCLKFEARMDQLVYNLYSLTAAERRLVEEAVGDRR